MTFIIVSIIACVIYFAFLIWWGITVDREGDEARKAIDRIMDEIIDNIMRANTIGRTFFDDEK
jgi:hypothetical protein